MLHDFIALIGPFQLLSHFTKKSVFFFFFYETVTFDFGREVI